MAMYLRCIAVLNFVLVFSVFGGNEVGNGGNTVVCGTKLELLDLFEARTLRSVEFEEYPSRKGTQSAADQLKQAIELALQRISALEVIDPRTARVYSVFLKALETETGFISESELVAIDDSKHVIVPAGCQVKQLAILRKSISPGEKRVLIEERLWSQLGMVDRVGLVLHEAIYRHLANLGQKDSTHVRFLVGFLLAKDFGSSSRTRYWEEIRRRKLPIYDPSR